MICPNCGHTINPPADGHTYVSRKASPTSRKASIMALPRTGTQRQRIYEAIVRSGGHGMTDFEIATSLMIYHNSVRPRRLELAEGGFIAKAPFTRPNALGNECDVWVAR